MQAQTHNRISSELCGSIVSLAAGRATVALQTTTVMAADVHGLVHGGFVFGLADYAAMLAVNHPNVVLGAAETRFLAPVRVGQEVVATAYVRPGEGKKRLVDVEAHAGRIEVFRGVFTTFSLDAHVLT